MKHLAKITSLTEHFYSQAMKALAQIQYASSTYVSPDTEEDFDSDVKGDLLQQAEAMWDQMDNPILADQFEKFIDSYRDYLNSLNGPPPESDSDESFSDIKNTMDARWSRLVQNPYLELEENDPKYTETVPPYKIVELIQNIVEDANAQKEAKASEMGLDAEELDAAEKAAQQEMFQGQVAKDVINRMDDAQKQQYANKVRKKLDYTKKFREKLKTIGKIGIDNLKRVREELTQKINNTTDAIARRELELRLKNIPDPRHLELAQEARKRNWQKIVKLMKDDTVFANTYRAEVLKRYHSHQGRNNEKAILIANIENSKDPNVQKQFLDKLVKLQKDFIARNYDLDNEWVRNDPEIQNQLDPNTIIKDHKDREAKRSNKNIEEAKRIKEVKDKRFQDKDKIAKLQGIITFYGQNINTQRRELKLKIYPAIRTKVYAKLAAAEQTEFKSYIDEINEAEKIKDEARKKQAIKKLNAALSNRADNDPLVKAYNEKAEKLTEYENDLMSISAQQEVLDQEKLTSLIKRGKELISEISSHKIFNPILKNINDMISIFESGGI